MNFKEFGWNGLIFEIPEEMHLASEGGNAKSAYYRLESEGYFIEVKWEPLIPKKAKPLSEIVEAFIKQTEKKTKQSIKVLKQDNAHVFSHNALHMNLKSQTEDHMYMWYCEESERTFIFRFAFGTLDSASKKIVGHVIDTLKCHTEGPNVWSILGLRFEAPQSFLLTDRKMAVGRAHFLLNDRKMTSFSEKGREILIEYFSMANVVFADTYKDLDKWLEKEYLKDLRKRCRGVTFQSKESQKLRRHNAVIKQGLRMSGSTTRKTSLFTNVTWYCSASNRIYSITISSHIGRPILFKRDSGEGSHKKLVEDFLLAFECH